MRWIIFVTEIDTCMHSINEVFLINIILGKVLDQNVFMERRTGGYISQLIKSSRENNFDILFEFHLVVVDYANSVNLNFVYYVIEALQEFLGSNLNFMNYKFYKPLNFNSTKVNVEGNVSKILKHPRQIKRLCIASIRVHIRTSQVQTNFSFSIK